MFGMDDELSGCETVLSERVEYIGSDDHFVVREAIKSAPDKFSHRGPCTIGTHEILSTDSDRSVVRVANCRNSVFILLNAHDLMIPQDPGIVIFLQVF